MAFAGIFVIGLLVLIVGGLVYGIILMSGGGGSRGGNGEMSCGGCGYAVRGLEALNCPECGGDLRQVGINRGQRSGGRGVGITLVVLCGACLLFGAFGFLMFNVKSGSPSQPVSAPLIQTQPVPPPVVPAQPALPQDGPAESNTPNGTATDGPESVGEDDGGTP